MSIQILDDPEVWSSALRERQCQRHLTRGNRRTDGSNRYHTAWQLAASEDEGGDARPDNAFVLGTWKQLMLGCSTVTIASHEHCVVCPPFVDICKEHIVAEPISIDQNISDRTFPIWLARTMSELALENVQRITSRR